MVGKRLTFTVDGDTYDRLRDDLGDESVDEWVRDAIRRKLNGNGSDGREPEGDGPGGPGGDGYGGEEDADDDYYGGPGEFVDDCSI